MNTAAKRVEAIKRYQEERLNACKEITINAYQTYPFKSIRIENFTSFTNLVWIVGGEARNQCSLGQQAVAQVVMNRWFAQRGYFGLSVTDVIHKNNGRGVYQFSAASPKNVNYRWWFDEDEKVWSEIAKNVAPIFYFELTVLPADCFYYHTNKITPPSWTERLIKYKEIQDHIFYTEKRRS